jgi:hypothetical protein
MFEIKTGGDFGYNECGDITVRLDCYEREMLVRALRIYKAVTEGDAADARYCSPDSPELASAEEWAARAAAFAKDSIDLNKTNF